MTQAAPASTPDPDAWARETEDKVLDAALAHVAHEGWTQRLATRAGADVGLSAGETELLLPNGAADLAALLARRHDRRALAALAGTDPTSLKIRERIRAGVEARLDAAGQDEAAVRRWTGFLALPQNLALGGRLLWDSADQLWRWAGDTATDENHYSKRAILSGILSAALALRLHSGRAASMAFVDARIANVMSFEKWKATTRIRPSLALKGLAQTLGRMRYG
ncbi:MAG: COQ9 family protein [Phenylobacterium sp.]|uniref:COQ9 family protein n=1 Tax=Phenylobacterium sp. TaxID=1871053 RepID=UPI00271C5A94|nr:COQ9 family protein [Phenylobacterium sp.]MDO8411200.1 COQ9 family protein [Phenylobacterium sp.]